MKIVIASVFLLLLGGLLLAPLGCGDDDSSSDADTDGDTDGDTDADGDTDVDTDADGDSDADGGTSYTCTPTMADDSACDPDYDCCEFPPPDAEVGMGVGPNACTGMWSNGGTEYEVDCEDLGSDAAICTCTVG